MKNLPPHISIRKRDGSSLYRRKPTRKPDIKQPLSFTPLASAAIIDGGNTRGGQPNCPPSRKLQHPLWRYGAIAGFSFPIAIALGVSIAGWSFPFPPCLFQATFGFPSPSCGLTRSFLALARGDWQTALSFHLFGPVLAAVFVAIAGVALTELITRRSYQRFYQSLFAYQSILPFLGLFLGYYALRLWARYTLPELPWDWGEMPVWHLFLKGTLAL